MPQTCSRCGITDSQSWYLSPVNCLCETCADADGEVPKIRVEAEDGPSACWICNAPTNEAEDLCGPCAAQRADTLRLVEELEAKGYGVKR